MSLIEVILMLVILGVVVVPLTKLSITNLKSTANYAVLTKAMYDARTVMETFNAYYAANGYATTVTDYGTGGGRRSGTTFNGFIYSVNLDAEQTLNGVTYREATVSISGYGLQKGITLKTWIVR